METEPASRVELNSGVGLLESSMRIRDLLLMKVRTASGTCAAEELSTAEYSSSDHPVIADVDAFFGAMRSGNLAHLGNYLADDYFLIGVGGNTRNKQARLAWLKDNVSLLSTVRPSELKVRYYGDVAVVTGLVSITDESPTVYERFTHVWAWKGTSWQMVSGQVTAVAPEP